MHREVDQYGFAFSRNIAKAGARRDLIARLSAISIAKCSATLTVALVVICAIPSICEAQAPTQSRSIAKQIDHILIASTEPEDLFSLLTETFQFPVAWPMKDYGDFASGGVAVGNINLEVIKATRSGNSEVKCRFTGLALEPEPLRSSLTELDARRIPHGAPAPFKSKLLESWKTLWTTVALPDVSSAAVEVFLCEYGHDADERRRRLVEQLRSRNGGPLTAHSIREVVYGVKDVQVMHERWQKLLTPLQPSTSGMWQLGADSAIRLVQADKDEIQRLEINVKSLERARAFLKQQRMLGADQPAAVTLAGPQFREVTIMLVEVPSKGAQ